MLLSMLRPGITVQKKSLPRWRKAFIFSVVNIHVNLSSGMVANNDNDDHDQCDSPVQLGHDVIDLVIFFVYPHGRR